MLVDWLDLELLKLSLDSDVPAFGLVYLVFPAFATAPPELELGVEAVFAVEERPVFPLGAFDAAAADDLPCVFCALVVAEGLLPPLFATLSEGGLGSFTAPPVGVLTTFIPPGLLV